MEVICLPERAPYPSLWKYLHLGQAGSLSCRACGVPCRVQILVFSTMWQLQEKLALCPRTSNRIFLCLFFHGKLTTLLIALWKVFRKVKTPLAILQFKISSSLNTENREGWEIAQVFTSTRTWVRGLSMCIHGYMHQHPHTQRTWAEVGRREGRMERGRERLRSWSCGS